MIIKHKYLAFDTEENRVKRIKDIQTTFVEFYKDLMDLFDKVNSVQRQLGMRYLIIEFK